MPTLSMQWGYLPFCELSFKGGYILSRSKHSESQDQKCISRCQHPGHQPRRDYVLAHAAISASVVSPIQCTTNGSEMLKVYVFVASREFQSEHFLDLPSPKIPDCVESIAGRWHHLLFSNSHGYDNCLGRRKWITQYSNGGVWRRKSAWHTGVSRRWHFRVSPRFMWQRNRNGNFAGREE